MCEDQITKLPTTYGVWLFSTVCFWIFPQMVCLRRGIAVVWLFPTVWKKIECVKTKLPPHHYGAWQHGSIIYIKNVNSYCHLPFLVNLWQTILSLPLFSDLSNKHDLLQNIFWHFTNFTITFKKSIQRKQYKSSTTGRQAVTDSKLSQVDLLSSYATSFHLSIYIFQTGWNHFPFLTCLSCFLT